MRVSMFSAPATPIRKRFRPGASWIAAFVLGASLCAPARAAVFTVTNLNDSGAGSLRQALIDSNGMGGADSIDFTVTGTINLLSVLPSITDDLSIDGPGADLLTLRRDDGAADFRIFTVDSGNTVAINGLTLSNGRAQSGAGILSSGNLTIDSCVIRDCVAENGGGGIQTGENADGSLVIQNSALLFNTVNVGDGGGLRYRHGGAPGNQGLVQNTTFSGNVAGAVSGGCGGAIEVSSTNPATLQVFISTITDNDSGFKAGGICIDGFEGDPLLILGGNIIAGNTAAFDPDLGVETSASFLSFGDNIVGDNMGVALEFPAGTPNFNGDCVGTAGSPVDPGVLPLGDYGGPTPTHALKADSIAVDAIADTFFRGSFPAGSDQRGQNRFADGDGDGDALEDIGAFELQRYPVTTLADAGAGSLRQAILDNAAAGAGLVDIENSGTILLQSVLPGLNCSVTIQGPGADCSEIRRDDGAPDFRIFTINAPARVTIQGVTIANGRSFNGAGISNSGHLTIDSCTIRDNVADSFGGGLSTANNATGSLVILNSAFVSNIVNQGNGGGLHYGHSGSPANQGLIQNTTFSGNVAGFVSGGCGGAISVGPFDDVTLRIFTSTITANTSGFVGGGVCIAGHVANSPTVILGGSIVAENTAGGSDPDLRINTGGDFLSFADNIIGDNSGVALFFPAGTPNVNGDCVGTSGSPLDPGVRPLGDYGGPTPTHALRPGSIAIDSIPVTSRGTFPSGSDQRGRPRFQDGDCDGEVVQDAGAYEYDDCRGGNVNATGLASVFSDDMESGSGNFTTFSPTSNGDWSIIATGNACSPGSAWFSSDISTLKDDYLDTVAIELPEGCSTLKFNHFYDLENTFDGAVIEISVDGSSFHDLGDRIIQGGYDSLISTSFGNPIAGRPAWSGQGTPCDEVIVDLAGLGGSTIRIRFRLACDFSVSGVGWFVDDVQICAQGGEMISDVLFVNGSAGVGVERRVTIDTGDPISIDLLTSPAGPATNARYFMYVWFGDSSNPAVFSANGVDFGVLVNPGPLQGGGPQPFRCLRGTGISPAICRNVQELPAPPRAPFSVVRPTGLSNTFRFTLQAMIEDFGSLNPIPFSVTNAVILDVQSP